ncbi:TPA: hypothetical protein ACOQ31_005647 [Bacillus cereus]|uniref:hypothetical protein n=1 Tax=Bacillus cereus TaxID=1396 RepID=UPI001927E658|nr:hypothetical protein [Bacillus cereus]MBL3768472.1 hypothetical protein [Bacillus cereus]MBL3774455.1 hypothetical protein [Bacillus cereus]MBL3780327.1 hypothetical protein [Bacillus cereus]MBL3791456.1 hypothetical protein [Bacillus cereus]
MRRPIPIVCYKKLENDTEVVIAEFKSIIEARRWAATNNIMNEGSVRHTLVTNDYLDLSPYRTAKYKYHHLYRFARVDLNNER